MQIFLKSKIIIFFGLFGFILSMILTLLSGAPILLVLVKSVTGGIILGLLGIGLDFFLKQTLSREDYESLITFNSAVPIIKSEAKPPDHKIDVMDDADQNTESVYQDLYKPDREETATASVKEPFPYNFNSTPEVDEIINEKEQAPQTIINEQLSEKNKTFEAGRADESSSYENKEINPKPLINEDLGRLNEINKEEQIKKESHLNSLAHENSISFRLKNKVINADPSIVAKAIKTILQRD